MATVKLILKAILYWEAEEFVNIWTRNHLELFYFYEQSSPKTFKSRACGLGKAFPQLDLGKTLFIAKT